AAAQPVTREDASRELGLERSLVAYHLDKLVDEGLLTVSFARPEGRTGPGAGRPAKRYERAAAEFSVSIPPRSYELAAQLLVRAVERDPGGSARAALNGAAAELGRSIAAQQAVEHGVIGTVAGLGYEPFEDGPVIRLRNCPFHRLAQEHTEVVCAMNLALLGGLAAEIDPSVEARLDPAPGRCCVALHRAQPTPRRTSREPG
ncbi:MAG TPA: hypothetical protein VML96_11450, partial [Egibacteraceae bacterium]|nr:hypothetical protein [Egibacteraceae bacterium]